MCSHLDYSREQRWPSLLQEDLSKADCHNAQKAPHNATAYSVNISALSTTATLNAATTNIHQARRSSIYYLLHLNDRAAPCNSAESIRQYTKGEPYKLLNKFQGLLSQKHRSDHTIPEPFKLFRLNHFCLPSSD